ncbi:hypothetical protein [Paenibacillus eucommiae]|uniref:Uncharacterized protein n=1 Tax=Paenibacillus eucommiae TaxID=1355755 RepID=A0ABS4IZ72_9BACL|nr:hypothetical protein [Paenibacillus eucommiae]MBP1991844.1 hypothetical protein [Paenibacillus eucommiae]
MVRRNNKQETAVEKLDHRVKVLLKEWAGLSGFYGYKSLELDEIFKLVNTEGWKTNVDKSDPAARIVEMVKEGTVRKAKFSLDEKGRALRDY